MTRRLFGAMSVILSLAVSPVFATYTLTTLVSFDGSNGSHPIGAVVSDANGNLYGTASAGGTHSLGTVFEMDSNTHAITTLLNFNGLTGENPHAALIFDANGNLYGTTFEGGSSASDGTLFKLAANTHQWTGLANFLPGFSSSFPYWGYQPNGRVIRDAAGNLYGTTTRGGQFGEGTVFEAVNAGSLDTLVSFSFNSFATGQAPQAGLVFDAHGNLYGTTSNGGPNGGGTVFEMTGPQHNNMTILTSFFTGSGPSSDLIFDSSGNLYGTTVRGGNFSLGSVFEYSTSTGITTTLASFDFTNGDHPVSGLIMDGTGNIYGTTKEGGANNDGTVFEVSAGTHALTTLATFDGINGATPDAGVILDATGNIYGTTASGGANGLGTVFEIAVPEPTPLAPLTIVAIGLAIHVRRRTTTMRRQF